MLIIYLIITILMLGLLFVSHEFGHFFAAKLCGVKVNEFSIGMGPTLLEKQKDETLYRLRAFPLNICCAMEGENEDTGDDRAFAVQPVWKKLVILAAGSFMNFVIGMVILAVVIFSVNAFPTNEVAGVAQDLPNHPEQFFQIGDRIVEVDGHVVFLPSDITSFLDLTGDTVDLVVERNGERIELLNYALAAVEQEDGSKLMTLGIFSSMSEETTWGAKLRYTWLCAVDSVRLVWFSLGELFRGNMDLFDMSGPVGITPVMSNPSEQRAQLAVGNGCSDWYGALMGILCLAYAFSVCMAVITLLPIPALDGGRIFFVLFNSIFTALTKKRLDPKYEGYINDISIALLGGLALAVALNNVWNLIL